MPDDTRAAEVFDRLAAIFSPYRPPLIARTNEPGDLYLETPPSTDRPNGFYFGAVKIGKRSVSFHLMPVYVQPDLLDDVSDQLRRRMQGKSCFNFTTLDPVLLGELQRLTAAGFAQFQEACELAPYAATRRKIVDAFWPPKPKPLTIAACTGRRRATFGT